MPDIFRLNIVVCFVFSSGSKTFRLNLLFAQVDVFEAAERYQKEGIPLIILAGKDYGSGNSRDWVAKGPYLLVNCFFFFFSSCDVYPFVLCHLFFLF